MKMKKQIAFACCALFFSASAATGASLPEKENFHIFLLMGQSNMEGAGYPVLMEYLKPSPQILMLNDQNEWVPDVAPFGRGMGPGDVFARYYAKLHPEATVGVIHAARGGRGIGELSRGGKDSYDGAPNYDRLIEKAKIAQKQGTIKAALWHQHKGRLCPL